MMLTPSRASSSSIGSGILWLPKVVNEVELTVSRGENTRRRKFVELETNARAPLPHPYGPCSFGSKRDLVILRHQSPEKVYKDA
jgi:hypothetical protein